MIKEAAIFKDGIIYMGKSHSWIIYNNQPQIKNTSMRRGIQGFITDAGIFVTRQEAAKIAFECGQIKHQQEVLMSEDLKTKQ